MACGAEHWSHKRPERVLRGEKNGGSKLTAREVRAIFARYNAGGITMRSLAFAYGVTAGLVCRIAHRKIWKHVLVS
jgi:hypothetical protein